MALHKAAVAAHMRTATYWHMLPEYAQARKAIWNAINPHSGKRRIDEAFPHEVRASTNDHEMFIRFKCGSTWQVVGSDNFNSLVGTPPAGIVFSEWALANPAAWAYLAPILVENGGWADFITTPRGRNHVASQLEAAKKNPDWFTQVLTVADTGFPLETVEEQRREYHSIFGPDDGDALIDQEYWCSFDAPLVGAFYAKLIAAAEKEGRVLDYVPAEPDMPVETAWDLGYTDDTVIWWFQVVGKEVRILDFYAASAETIEHYCNVIYERAKERQWSYGPAGKEAHWVPWDARPRTLASGGKSILEQAWAQGVRMRVAPNLDVQDGIQAVRRILPRCWFDSVHCKDGIEALRNYSREWDEDKKVFKRQPLHNWASHPADAFRIMAVAQRERMKPVKEEPKPMQGMEALTLDRLFEERESEQRRWR